MTGGRYQNGRPPLLPVEPFPPGGGGYTGRARTARNGVFGRVEAYDSVPATIDEIDPDRSYDEVAAVGREGIDR